MGNRRCDYIEKCGMFDGSGKVSYTNEVITDSFKSIYCLGSHAGQFTKCPHYKLLEENKEFEMIRDKLIKADIDLALETPTEGYTPWEEEK